MALNDWLSLENHKLNAIISYLVSEFGQADPDWLYASIKIPSIALTGDYVPALMSTDETPGYTSISVTLEQPKEEPQEAKSRQVIESQTNGVCRNCGKEIYKAKAWTSLWFHKEHGRSECDLGSGTWARPRKKF